MGNVNQFAAKEAVKDSIYRSCLLMDDERWSDWLELCDDGFYYKITAYSPEIRKCPSGDFMSRMNRLSGALS